MDSNSIDTALNCVKTVNSVILPIGFCGMIFAGDTIMDDEKITIIEGPTPTFEQIEDGWALGLDEGPLMYDMALTRLRTFNGPALVERCVKAWKNKKQIYLHYKDRMGLIETAPIMAARSVETDDGHVILLWVRQLLSEDETDEMSDNDSSDNYLE